MHVFVGLMILNQFNKIVSPTSLFKRTYKNASASRFSWSVFDCGSKLY